MPEFVHAKRGLEGAKRIPLHINLNTVSLGFSPWPNNSALALTFDCEGTYGGGKTIKGETELVPEFSEKFQNLGIQATFNFLGKIAYDHPEVLQFAKEKNQDIAGHGFSHCNLDGLSEKEQRSEIERTIAEIKNACGEKVIGFRAPYCTFDLTTYKLFEEYGIKWTSNFGRSLWGDFPFRVSLESKEFQIIDIPFDDIHFDAWIFKRHNIEFKQALLLYKNHIFTTKLKNGIFTLLAHPAGLALDRGRAEVILKLAEYAAKQKNLWVTSLNNIYKRWITLNNLSWHIRHKKESRNSSKYELVVENKNPSSLDDLVFIINHHKDIKSVKSNLMWMYDKDAIPQKRKILLRASTIKAHSTQKLKFAIISK
jgi:peptidoglycan/xylan/chitin deacetylase (PgdA/CDA1 family)